MKNDYVVEGDVTVIYIQSQKYGTIHTEISTRSLEKVLSFPNKWAVKRDTKSGNFYVYGRISKNNKQITYLLHRWITSAEKNLEVDHINHKTLDNTDDNLRIVSIAENQQNRAGATTRSKTGVRGVYWHTKSQRWCAQIRVNNKKIYGGFFKNFDDAVNAINKVKKKFTPMSLDITAAE